MNATGLPSTGLLTTDARILPANCMSLVLASGSPRRKTLLERLGFTLTVEPSSVEEYFDESVEPSQMAVQLADAKASEIASKYPDRIVLGADTIVVLDGLMMAKPLHHDDAARMLQLLSGRTHQVWTGVCLVHLNNAQKIHFVERTDVQFAALTEEEIQQYITTAQPFDKAGAYGIQDDWGSVFVTGIVGDFYNVVGLPLHALYRHLKRMA